MDSDRRQPVQNNFDWNSLTLFLILICAIVLSLLIAQPFFPAITAAVVLAVVTQHPHKWISARLRNPTLAATASLLLVVLSIVGPAIFFAQSAGFHILGAVRAIQSGVVEQNLRQFAGQHSRISAMLQYAIDNVDISQTIEKSAGSVAMRLGALLGGSVAALVQVVVMLFILFFLYRDKSEGVSFVRSFLPLNDEETDYLLSRIRMAVQALVIGRFVVAGVQGLVAGITYACLGVGGASLLGLATMLFALVPAVGAFVIWLPIVIYLALAHHWIQAVILLGIGSLIISTLDNILYPILVGTKMQLHTVPIFLAMLGGVWFFGVSGLVLGPIAFIVTDALVLIWRRRTAGEQLPAGPAAT
jgi:predicted PurR-regulated permease PerM